MSAKQPTTTREGAEVCSQFCQMLNPSIKVVVDDVTDVAGTAYSGMPARLYVIDTAGRVSYKSGRGRGPFGFKPNEMEQALAMALLEAVPVDSKK